MIRTEKQNFYLCDTNTICCSWLPTLQLLMQFRVVFISAIFNDLLLLLFELLSTSELLWDFFFKMQYSY